MQSRAAQRTGETPKDHERYTFYIKSTTDMDDTTYRLPTIDYAPHQRHKPGCLKPNSAGVEYALRQVVK